MRKIWIACFCAALLVPTWGTTSWANAPHSAADAGKGKVKITGCTGKGNITFMFWGDKGDLFAQTQSIKAAEKACPGLHVTAAWHQSDYDTALKTAIGSGNAPDLFQLDGSKRVPQYVTDGALTNLDSYVKRDNLNLSKVFWKQCLGEMSYKGHTYGLMRSCGNQKILFYNKDMFDAQHLQYPNSSWTLNDFAAAAQKLSGNYATASDTSSKLRFGWGWHSDDFGMETMLYQYGADWLSKDLHTCTLTSTAARQAFQWWHDLRWKLHGAATPAQGALGGDWFSGFQKGTVGMTFAGAWAENYLFNHSPGSTGAPVPFKWGATLLPKGPKTRLGIMAATAEVVSSRSKNKNAAYWLARFVTEGQGAVLQGASGIDTPGAKALWNNPAVKAEFGSLLPVAYQANLNGRTPTLVPQYDDFSSTVQAAMDTFWNSESGSVDDATAQACKDVQSKGLLP
jgi:multiple sugar transport system substrate-binding protein